MAGASVGARLRSLALAVWHYVSGAPLTYGWLAVLLITTIIQHQLPRRELHSVLLHRSTNIHELATDPLTVLFSSLLWIDGKSLEPYLLLFTLFLAPVEHWLGHLKWLTIGLTGHILSTYISESVLYFAIEEHDASERLVHSRDIGVSYFLVAIMAVLTYRIERPWRWLYLGVLLIIFGFPLLTMTRHGLDFTAIGHFTSVVVGLCFYPMARAERDRQWSPARARAAFRRFRYPGELPG